MEYISSCFNHKKNTNQTHTNTHMNSYSFGQKAIEKQQAHTQGARGQCIYITLFQTKAELRKQRLEEKPSHFNSVFCSWNSAFFLQSLTQNYKDSIHTQRLKAQRTLDTIWKPHKAQSHHRALLPCLTVIDPISKSKGTLCNLSRFNDNF